MRRQTCTINYGASCPWPRASGLIFERACPHERAMTSPLTITTPWIASGKPLFCCGTLDAEHRALRECSEGRYSATRHSRASQQSATASIGQQACARIGGQCRQSSTGRRFGVDTARRIGNLGAQLTPRILRFAEHPNLTINPHASVPTEVSLGTSVLARRAGDSLSVDRPQQRPARLQTSAAGNDGGKPAESSLPARHSQAEGGSDGSRLTPFEDFWNVGNAKAGVEIGESLARQTQNKMNVQFLIATVPDPIDSRFAYRFDLILDSIEDAVEFDRWNLDHFWLPWDTSGRQPGTDERLKSTLVPDPPAGKSVESGRTENDLLRICWPWPRRDCGKPATSMRPGLFKSRSQAPCYSAGTPMVESNC